jgi:hypothetical protein
MAITRKDLGRVSRMRRGCLSWNDLLVLIARCAADGRRVQALEKCRKLRASYLAHCQNTPHRSATRDHPVLGAFEAMTRDERIALYRNLLCG